jgi:hypothetical protein
LGLYGDSAFTDVTDALYERVAFKLYPNPTAEGRFTVQVNDRQHHKHSIQLYSYTGSLLFEDAFEGANYNHGQRLIPGVYLVVLATENARSVRKLVVDQ